MASIKNLKKEINFLAGELVYECYFTSLLSDSLKKDEVNQLIASTIDYRNNFIAQANHRDGKNNPKLVKTYFKGLRKNLYTELKQLTEKLKAI